MKQKVLMVNCDRGDIRNIQQEYLKSGLLLHMLPDISDAVNELLQTDSYLLVVLCFNKSDILIPIKIIRSLVKIPILVIKNKYNSLEKIAAIEAGADEYIQRPEIIQEGIASCYALIRRFTVLNYKDENRTSILLQGNIYINVDYRKVFVHAKELELARREFDLFYLLVSNPDRVFTYEQLCEKVWGSDYAFTENGLHSCIRRLRRKLESILASCIIENMRGVGYCFRLST